MAIGFTAASAAGPSVASSALVGDEEMDEVVPAGGLGVRR